MAVQHRLYLALGLLLWLAFFVATFQEGPALSPRSATARYVVILGAGLLFSMWLEKFMIGRQLRATVLGILLSVLVSLVVAILRGIVHRLAGA